jgi:magnesium and cobalt exporter, CNNM family
MEIIIILLLVLLNGAFSMAEMALVSVRKPRLQQWADGGNSGAQAALDLADKPESFLPITQLGMTLIGILAGAFGEQSLSGRIESYVDRFPRLAAYGPAIALVAVVVSITYVSVVIGELVPKRVALHNPERLASVLAKPMKLISRAGRPFVGVLNASTNAILGLLRISRSEDPPVTEEEIKVIMEQGAEAGVIEKTEHEMVNRLFRLNDRAVEALMKPRRDIVSLDIDAPVAENMEKVAGSAHSRFPVVQGSLDRVIGIVQENELLKCYLAGKPPDLKDAARVPLFVPAAVPAFRLLEMFKASHTHIALVVDEYGAVEGLVTINDFFEDLVGEVASAPWPQKRHAVQRPDGSWLVDGKMTIHDFKELMNLAKLPGEERRGYHTLGGFVMVQIGRVPVAADTFEAQGLCFEVVDMDENRVDKVLVQRKKVAA